jgi:cellulose synthase/poly-beta-1,6-N-acetylglucosamine synthase-like glycosyltransferase
LFGANIEASKPIPEIAESELPMVSVVVPARNEEEKIAECIRSIAANKYPLDKFEIIAVNDRSEDKTGHVLEKLAKEIINFKPVHNDGSKTIKNLQGKPGALQLAINHCKGDIIVMTDADCTVSENWIASHAKCFSDKSLGICAAYTDIKGEGFFTKIQAVEWLYLHVMAIGGMGLGMPLSCYGNNISISKEAFDKIGGYENIAFCITEDLALLQAMHKNKYKTRHLSHTDSMIRTLPNPTFKDYWVQHHRWAVGALDLGFKAFVFVLTSLSIWAALVLSLAQGCYELAGGILLLRILLDSIFILPSMLRLERKDLLVWLAPGAIFLLIMELVAPFYLLKRDVTWKGQVFTENK